MMGHLSSKRISIWIAVLLVCLLAGCNQTQGNSQTSAPATLAETSQQTTQATNAPTPEPTPQPSLEPITLTTLAGTTDTSEDVNTPWRIEMEKRTGVHLDFILTTDYDTKFNLLVSSNELPDLFGIPASYPGGMSKAASDGLIVTISDYWDQYAPHLKALAESKPEWSKELKADDSKVYAFPIFREDQTITVFFGPMIRKDLLDAEGLAVPETIDEWHTALAAFKQKGVTSPFTSLNWFVSYCDAFVGAYGASSTGYIVPGPDDKMHYGPIEEGYKQFLETFRQWYAEGLIDPDYPTLTDWGVVTTKMTTGESAAMLHFLGTISDCNVAGQKTNPNYKVVATKYPVLNKGDKPLYGEKSPSLTQPLVLNAACKHIERAINYFDYYYTPEGQVLTNFGIEGVSYTLDANGKPVYTDLITADTNSQGQTQEQALTAYCPSAGDHCVGVQLASYFQQIRLKNDIAREAVALWAEPTLSSFTPSVSLTEAENKTAAKLADVETYVNEMTAKFILGTEPISNFDQYVTRCRELGIDEVLAVYNAAYERYKNR